jgi:hypothetical protein
MVTKPEASSSTGKATLIELIAIPLFKDQEVSREPPVSLGYSQEDPYAWDESPKGLDSQFWCFLAQRLTSLIMRS